MGKNQYYFIVSDRIREVENELSNLLIKYYNDKDYEVKEVLNLEIEIVREKLKYLKDIELLPLYAVLQSLSHIQIFEIETKKEISFKEVEHRLGLDKVKEIMQRSKTTTLSYLKELFINDYSSMKYLIDLQSVNFMCNEKIRFLYNNGENSIAQINIRERQLSRLEENTYKIIRDLEEDYNFNTLKEVNHYMRFCEEKLSREFVLKHQDKVIKNNPKMEKVIKNLTRKEKFRFISRFFKSKRNKNEERFLNSVCEAYKSDVRLSSLGLSSSEDLLSNSNTIKKFIKKLNKQVSLKTNEIKKTREDINNIKSSVLSEIKYYEDLKEKKKKSFITLLKSKTNFLPKMFGEQLWNEPNLKNSLIKVSCLDEEKKLLEKLSVWNINKEEKRDISINIKKLTA